MKKLPQSIHHCGFDYEIIVTDRLDGRESWGRTQNDIQKIYIDADLSYEKQVETLIHEMLHVALRATGYTYDDKQEETIIRAWSMNIYGILKDNGFLKEGFLKEVK